MAKKSISKTLVCNYKAQQYCFKKGFIIYPEPFNGGFKIYYQLGHKGKYYSNGELFSKNDYAQAIWDLYNKIYEHDKNK